MKSTTAGNEHTIRSRNAIVCVSVNVGWYAFWALAHAGFPFLLSIADCDVFELHWVVLSRGRHTTSIWAFRAFEPHLSMIFRLSSLSAEVHLGRYVNNMILDFAARSFWGRKSMGISCLPSKLCRRTRFGAKIWLIKVSGFLIFILIVTAERDALAVSKCPFIVHLYYSLQTVTHVYLVRFPIFMFHVRDHGVSYRWRFKDPAIGNGLPQGSPRSSLCSRDFNCPWIPACPWNYTSRPEAR